MNSKNITKNITCVLSIIIMLLVVASAIAVSVAYPSFVEEHHGLSCLDLVAGTVTVALAALIFLFNYETKKPETRSSTKN